MSNDNINNCQSFYNYFKMLQKLLKGPQLYNPTQDQLLSFFGITATDKNSTNFLKSDRKKWVDTVDSCILFMKDPAAGLALFFESCNQNPVYTFPQKLGKKKDLDCYSNWKASLTTDEYSLFRFAIEKFEMCSTGSLDQRIIKDKSGKNYTISKWDYLVLLFPLTVIITCSYSHLNISSQYSEQQILDAYRIYYQVVFEQQLPNLNYLSLDHIKESLGNLDTAFPSNNEVNFKKLVTHNLEPSVYSENTRNDFIKQINDVLDSHNLVVIYAEAGMGKSEVAKMFAHAMSQNYTAIQFVSSENGIKDAITSVRFKNTLTKTIRNDDAKTLFQRNFSYLCELDSKNLIIFDNLDYPTPQDIQYLVKLTGISAHIIVTSRHNFEKHDYLRGLALKPLDEKAAIRLFYSYYNNGVKRQSEDRNNLINILNFIGYNTLFIKLIASNLQNNPITMKELGTAFANFDYNEDIWINIEHITDRNNIEPISCNMLGHLKVIFNFSTIMKDQNSVIIMQAMALIPFFGIHQRTFYQIFFNNRMTWGTFVNTSIALSSNGWLEIESGILRLHPAISYMMIADEDIRPEYLKFNDMDNVAFCLYEYIHPIILKINNFQHFNGNLDEINEQTNTAIQTIHIALFMIPRILCYEEQFFMFLCELSTSCRLFDLLDENHRLIKFISQVASHKDFNITNEMAQAATTAYFDAAMFYTFIEEFEKGESFLLEDNLPSYVKKSIESSPSLHAQWVDNLMWCVFNQAKSFENCIKSVRAFAKEITILENHLPMDNDIKKEISSMYYNIGTVLSEPVMKLTDQERTKVFTYLVGLPNVIHTQPKDKYGCYEIAESYIQKSIQIKQELYQEKTDIECTREKNQIAYICIGRSRLMDKPDKKKCYIRQAIKIYRDVFDLRLKKFGRLSHYTVTQYINLGNAYRELYQCTGIYEDFQSASNFYEIALKTQEYIYGKNSRYKKMLNIANDFKRNKK